MDSRRRFITRLEAHKLIGCQHAGSYSRSLPGVKVACRDPRTGEVHEALEHEVVHFMIFDRVGHHLELEEGFTIFTLPL